MRSLCTLLALDGEVAAEVTVLRRQLLRLIHCREFSDEAEFKVGVRGGGRGVGGLEAGGWQLGPMGPADVEQAGLEVGRRGRVDSWWPGDVGGRKDPPSPPI